MGGHTAQFFLKKITFRNKSAEGVAGVLARIFHHPYPGVTPPRIRRTGPPSSDFFGKKVLKKNFKLAKKMAKKKNFKIVSPIVF